MRQIKVITDYDCIDGEPHQLHEVSRRAARGVLFDQEGLVAMMELTTLELIKLPGGGIDDGEEPETAFLREVQEETGYQAVILQSLGYIDEHKFRNLFLQRSYCYTASLASSKGETSLTSDERQLGMQVSWMKPDEAVETIRRLLVACEDYSCRFMLLRDLTILELVIPSDPQQYGQV